HLGQHQRPQHHDRRTLRRFPADQLTRAALSGQVAPRTPNPLKAAGAVEGFPRRANVQRWTACPCPAARVAATLQTARLIPQNRVYQVAAFALWVSKSESCRVHATGAPVRDDLSVADLVARAAGSDEGAWNELVDRYSPLVWSICVRYQLSRADIEDVGQTVWLRLVEHLGKLREPAALPGWLATTTQRECVRVVKTHRKCEVFGTDPDDSGLPMEMDTTTIE